MRLRPSVSFGCAVTLAALSAPAVAAGPDDGERLRRTPDGRPDPRGVRDFRSLTPFEPLCSVAVPVRKNDLPVFEYAGRRGNHGMPNLMASTRAEGARKAAAEGGR